MKRNSLFLSLLLSMFLWSFSSADQEVWTEKKLGQVIMKAERAAMRKKWSRAIQYGEQMLSGSRALDKKDLPRYIILLKNVNSYYDKAGRLQEVPAQVKRAYLLSSEKLGLDHPATMKSRTLYYKILIADKKYLDAIPLISEKIALSEKNAKMEYQTLQYLTTLHSLYALTRQYEKEEKTLLKLLDLNTILVGIEDESNSRIILDLANNYCRQKKYEAFNRLINTHHLKLVC